MSEDFAAHLQTLGTVGFMKLYSHPSNHNGVMAARLTQESLARGRTLTRASTERAGGVGPGLYPPNPNPSGPVAAIQAETARRGLTYPDSWIDAGILSPEDVTGEPITENRP